MVRKPIKIKKFVEKIAKDAGISVMELSTEIGRKTPEGLGHSLRKGYLSVTDLQKSLSISGKKLILIYDNHKYEIEFEQLKEKKDGKDTLEKK